MDDLPDFSLPPHLLDLRFGGHSVRENLRSAVQEGRLLLSPAGRLALPEPLTAPSASWLFSQPTPTCLFYLHVLFDVVYARTAVPLGCRDCFKVKVCPPDFKGLLAFRDLARSIPRNSKCGPEMTNPHTREWYGGYFYCRGLEETRATYRQVRMMVDAAPALGTAVPMRIKRGCTVYEIHCGPSDQWRFQDELAELEVRLLAGFELPTGERSQPEFAVLMRWVELAHAIGDDSYLEYTRGHPLYPASVSYEP